jgi:uncharacterized membrane protein
MALGKFHVVLVHFPIALAVAAVLGDVLWIIWRKDFFRSAAFYCLLLAALTAIPTVITGDQHLDEQHYSGSLQSIAQKHESFGIASMCVLIAAAGVRAIRRNRPKAWWLGVYVLLIAAIAALISITGYYGGDEDALSVLRTWGRDQIPGKPGWCPVVLDCATRCDRMPASPICS